MTDFIITVVTALAFSYLVFGGAVIAAAYEFTPVKCEHGYYGLHENEECLKRAKREQLAVAPKTNGDAVMLFFRITHPVTFIIKWWYKEL